ncbi:hypothetical protein ACOME3_007384 [Neoechinorhynchus agilis]
MTWGVVSGTPICQNTPSFRIAKTPKREELARRLSERANAQANQRKQNAIIKYLDDRTQHRTPSTQFTPAARRLLNSFTPNKDEKTQSPPVKFARNNLATPGLLKIVHGVQKIQEKHE